MIHFVCYISVYQSIFTCDCSLFSHNITLSEILCQATYRTWWKYIDPFCPTFSCFLYSTLFPLLCPSWTLFQPFSLTSVLAKSIRDWLVRHSQCEALGVPDLRCHCPDLLRIRHLPFSHLRPHLDYPSHHSSWDNFRCLKCFHVHYPHHFQLDDGWFSWFSGHLILVFVLQGGPLRTKLVAKVIFPTI